MAISGEESADGNVYRNSGAAEQGQGEARRKAAGACFHDTPLYSTKRIEGIGKVGEENEQGPILSSLRIGCDAIAFNSPSSIGNKESSSRRR